MYRLEGLEKAQAIYIASACHHIEFPTQLVQHLEDCGFTVYDINGNVDENSFETEGV